VIDHYNKSAGLHDPYLDQDIQPLALTESNIDDLVAFMASLTSANYKEQGATELARQRAFSRTNRPQRDTARAFGPKPSSPLHRSRLGGALVLMTGVVISGRLSPPPLWIAFPGLSISLTFDQPFEIMQVLVDPI
jgi:hypothetical protein